MVRKLSCFIMIGLLVVLTGCASTTKSNSKTSCRETLDTSKKTTAAQETAIVKMSNQEIQIALKNAGYYEGSIDGILGSRSRDAIRRFQQDNGLKDDSIAGPRTQQKLAKYINTNFKP